MKGRRKVNAKIDSCVLKMVRTITSWDGITVGEYLSRVARAAAAADLARVLREMEAMEAKIGMTIRNDPAPQSGS